VRYKMGIQKLTLDFLHRSLDMTDVPLGQIRMCELGNQELRKNTQRFLASQKLPRFTTGKEYFTHLGVDHVSIDLNGQDGALPFDLCKPIQDPNLVETFDVVTNMGTSEHVEDQFQCFYNIHRLGKAGALFIHLIPEVGSYPGHGLHKYNHQFFKALSEECKYGILYLQTVNIGQGGLVGAVLQKGDAPFLSEQDFQVIWSKTHELTAG